MTKVYTIQEHRHRLAAWAASTGAGRSPLCRFEVEQGVAVLRAAGFDAGFSLAERLPDPLAIDETHCRWRSAVIAAAERRGCAFTHGVAAKLINIYLKVRFVVEGQHEEARVRSLHPPIDDILLGELITANVGGLCSKLKEPKHRRWSKYNSDEYEEVIGLFRSVLRGQPLWTIEQYWKGHQ